MQRLTLPVDHTAIWKRKQRMRIAIVGSGISGLVAAHHLHREHDITVFEANAYVGGHTNTVHVDYEGESHAIDTGFIVFNDRTYPNFCRLMDELQVDSRPTSMSFSVRCDRAGLEYNGTSLNGLFSQRRNLFRPSFHRMIRDILRFNRQAPRILDGDCDSIDQSLRSTSRDDVTIGEYLRRERYSAEFADHYLLPMGAAIWSCPTGRFAEFPLRFIVEFYKNHGLLSLTDRPTWRVITGGSQAYVRRITAPFRDSIRLDTPVVGIRRREDGVDLRRRDGGVESFDHVVLACHSDQALRMLDDPSDVECDVLTAFPYERNTAVLHTDISLLPKHRRAWASWNYRIREDESRAASVTYNMNILQHIRSRHVFCVSLNSDDFIASDKVLARFVYHHPVYTIRRAAAQRRHAELLNRRHTSFCGAYWGNGFHEDGVNSALAVCRALARAARPEEVAA